MHWIRLTEWEGAPILLNTRHIVAVQTHYSGNGSMVSTADIYDIRWKTFMRSVIVKESLEDIERLLHAPDEQG